jgi:hypothetical protein
VRDTPLRAEACLSRRCRTKVWSSRSLVQIKTQRIIYVWFPQKAPDSGEFTHTCSYTTPPPQPPSWKPSRYYVNLDANDGRPLSEYQKDEHLLHCCGGGAFFPHLRPILRPSRQGVRAVPRVCKRCGTFDCAITWKIWRSEGAKKQSTDR